MEFYYLVTYQNSSRLFRHDPVREVIARTPLTLTLAEHYLSANDAIFVPAGLLADSRRNKFLMFLILYTAFMDNVYYLLISFLKPVLHI